eukprot:1662357-Pyramimonas_sp.AAC.1
MGPGPMRPVGAEMHPLGSTPSTPSSTKQSSSTYSSTTSSTSTSKASGGPPAAQRPAAEVAPSRRPWPCPRPARGQR